jgi:sugar lactone lactonase YvrE
VSDDEPQFRTEAERLAYSEVRLPQDWLTRLNADGPQGATFVSQPRRYRDESNGAECMMAGLCTDGDGTNFWAVQWPGGGRYLCLSPHTNWAIEERYVGQLTRRYRAVVEQVWKTLMASAINANRQARARREQEQDQPPPQEDTP